MKRYFFFVAILFSFNAFGAAMPVPPQVQGSVVFSKDLLDKKTLNGAQRIGDSSFFFSQTRGGSGLLGVLLGPIGVLVNSSLVANKTADESQSSSLQQDIDLNKLVHDSIGNSQSVEGKSNAYIEPFVLIRTNSNDQVMISLAYVIAVKNGNDLLWKEKYYYHFNRNFPKSVLTSGEGKEFQEYLRGEIPSAVKVLSDFAVADLTANTSSPSAAKAKSAYFGWLPGPFDSLLLANNDGLSKLRVNANDVFENMYARGMHIMANELAEIK